MAWIKAFHIISFVAWFAGLFYLPRLFVYHADTQDFIGQQRFQVMEHKLYYYIMLPAAVLTLAFGIGLFIYAPGYYLHAAWMQIKLFLVLILIVFHIYCGKVLYDFKQNKNKHSARFYRWLNELPTLLLIAIVLLAEIQP